MLSRRQTLTSLFGLVAMRHPLAAHAAHAAHWRQDTRFATAWDVNRTHHVGVLLIAPDGLLIDSALVTPTRAHGTCIEPGGTLLSVARRPGDWLVRWTPQGQALSWQWIEPLRAFNGHALCAPDGRRIYTSETDLETGAGLIGVRDARTLRKLDEWPTHGMDPHELLWLPDSAQKPQLVVANGGIPTLPETGRLKIQLDRMDSSLVQIDANTGTLTAQWRLNDQRLSLRHIAWHPSRSKPQPLLGMALQAEHDDAERKQTAPLLALWRPGQAIQLASNPPLAGYGGDIAPTTQGFAVSAPKANGVALWQLRDTSTPDAPAMWSRLHALDQACALCGSEEGLWVGFSGGAARLAIDTAQNWHAPAELRIDNHWVQL